MTVRGGEPRTAGGGPLTGFRIIDLTHFVAGPWATMILADLGADVIKVEPPGGEIGRAVGGVYANGHSAIFLAFNRSKRSLAVNLKHPHGRELVARLCAGSDCVIDNYRPGTAKRLGVDHETLSRDNPRLVGCSLSAFGTTGPYVDRPANDPIIQGITGALRETGAGTAAVRMGVSVPDFAGALSAALGVVAALYERERSGRGRHVDTTLLDSQLFSQLDRLTEQGLVPSRPVGGGGRLARITRSAFACADGRWVVVAPDDDASWRRLVQALGHDELVTTATGAFDAAVAAVTDAFAARPAAHWAHVLDAADVPATVMLALVEVFSAGGPGHPLVSHLDHPELGRMPYVRTPTGGAPTAATAPPLLGEHTEEILENLGYSAVERNALIDEGVVLARA